MVYNKTREKYCGPKFFLDKKNRLACNFSDNIYQAGGGLLLSTAINYADNFAKTYSRSEFEIHSVEMRVTLVKPRSKKSRSVWYINKEISK